MFRKTLNDCPVENELASMRLGRMLSRPSVQARSLVNRRSEPLCYEPRSML